MALEDAIFGAIADFVHIVVNAIAKKLGRSEIKIKKIEGYIFWVLLAAITTFIFILTLKYS